MPDLLTDDHGTLQDATTGHTTRADLKATDATGRPLCPCALLGGGQAPGEVAVRPALVQGAPVRLVCGQLQRHRVVCVLPLPLALGDPAHLTPREAEVLHLVCEGYTDREIARVLGISPGTVRTHVRQVREKLDAHTRTEAAARALMQGLL